MEIQPKLVTCWRALSDIQHGSRSNYNNNNNYN